MTAQEYYHRVFDRLKNCFQFSHYVLASGSELAGDTDDAVFPVIAEPVRRLENLTTRRALQVHIPIIGAKSQSVLMPLDFEIFLAEENHTLYENKETQKALLKQIVPVSRFIENFFRSRGMPYLFDYTASGGHVLCQNLLGYRATEALKNIGFLEEDLIKACNYIDSKDIRRRYGISLDAARVFSGIGKIVEYIALHTMKMFKDNESEGLFPIAIADCCDRCVNIDNSWSEGSPYMRSIRSPFSLHKKNREIYGKRDQPPLVDVIGTYFDGRAANEETRLDFVQDCMWDLEKAADHAQRFSGYIPCSNETMIDLISEYKSSDLYRFHRDFEGQKDMPRGSAIDKARKSDNLTDRIRHILSAPNPSALQPKNMIALVEDLLIIEQWKPKHIANLLRDLYQNPSYHWTQDFFKYPAEEKANFWARTYSAVTLWKTGALIV